MRFGILAALLGALGSVWLAAAPARTEERDEAIHLATALVDEVVGGEVVDQMVSRAWPAFEPQLRAAMPHASPAALDGFRAEYQRIVAEHARELIGATPIIYAKYFTADELRAMLAFYRSPAGRKALAVMPQVIADSVKLSVARLPDLTAEIDQAFRASLKTKGVDLPI